jgi:hypothetical protein
MLGTIFAGRQLRQTRAPAEREQVSLVPAALDNAGHGGRRAVSETGYPARTLRRT